MIAPCGINCNSCIGHLRDKNKCPGCLSTDDKNKLPHCNKCSIKYCDEKNDKKFLYCHECIKFPCLKMKKLDKRYREKYSTSLINNLNEIKNVGIIKFIEKEDKKWLCKNCGSVISVHRNVCLNCDCEYIKEPNFIQ